jgi:hypothetical protein
MFERACRDLVKPSYTTTEKILRDGAILLSKAGGLGGCLR